MKISRVLAVVKSKYDNSPIQAKASLWYAVCNFLQKGISFVIIPIYVRVLTTAEYGQYSVFQSWREILMIFATLNLYCGVFTKAMVDIDDDKDSYISSMQGLSTLITGVLFIIYLIKYNFWNNIFEMDTITMMIMMANFIFYPALSFWSVRQRVENKYKKMVAVTLGISVATPIISLILLFSTNLRVNAIIWGSMLVQCIVGAILYFYHFAKGKVLFVKEYWIRALKFNIPLIPHYLSLIILAQADRVMIKKICGSEKVGIYNLAYQLSMVMNIFISAINNTLVPWSYEKLRKKEYSEIKKISSGICLIMAVCIFIVIIVAPEIVWVVATLEYYDAIWIIPAVCISCYFTFCYNLFSTVEFYYGATRFVMVASVIGAFLNIILNMIFIPIYGYIAAGYTTMICYLVFMFMHYIFMRKVCKKNTENNMVYDIKFIVLSSIILCMAGGICMCLYNYIIVRYIIFVTILISIFFNKNKITNILKKMR